MATKNFTQFSTATPLTTSDYIVGYNAAGTAEIKTTVKQIVDLVGESDSQTLSFNNTTKDLSISSGNTVSLSALTDIDNQSVNSLVQTASGNWNDAFNTGTVYKANSGDYISLDENNSLSARFIPYSGTVQEIDSYVGIEGEIVSDKATIRLMNGLNPGGIKMLTENDSSGATSSEGGALPLNAANTLFVSSRQPSQSITLQFGLLGTGARHFLACQLWDGAVQVLSATVSQQSSTIQTSFTVPTTGTYRGAAIKNMTFWPCLSTNDTRPNPAVNFLSIDRHTNPQFEIENVSSYGLQGVESIGFFNYFNYTGNILDLRKTSVARVNLAICPNLYEIFGLNERKSTLVSFQLGTPGVVDPEYSLPAPNFQQTKIFENITSFTSIEQLILNLPNLTTITGLNLPNLTFLDLEAPITTANFTGCEKLLNCLIKSQSLVSFDSLFMNPFYAGSTQGQAFNVILNTPILETFVPPATATLNSANVIAFLAACPYLSGGSKVNAFFNDISVTGPGSEISIPQAVYDQPGINFSIAENKNWTVYPI